AISAEVRWQPSQYPSSAMVHTPMQGLRTARNGESIVSLSGARRLPRKKKAASTWIDAAWWNGDPMLPPACPAFGRPEPPARLGGGDGALERAPLRHFTLTSWTSKTTAWFGPIGDCGVLP